MGRKRTVNLNLPVRMKARVRSSGTYYYYFDGQHEIALGKDYVDAIRQWAQLEGGNASRAAMVTFRQAAEKYTAMVIPTKAPRTQSDNLKELAKLLEFFDNPPAPLEAIEPQHVRQYMDWRSATAKTRANREKALLSHIWNFSRQTGLTTLPNPCSGVRGFTETGRKDVYIEDEVYAAVYACANQSLKDALDMAYLTGQRPADVLKMRVTDIRNDLLAVRQGKTGKTLRIKLNNNDGSRNGLGLKIDEIMERKRLAKVADTAMIVAMGGGALTYSGLDNAFERARKKAVLAAEKSGKPELSSAIAGFQFRDLRAKAGTEKADSAGILEARQQLGHGSVTTTERYVRLGTIVSPTK